ncbi:protein kinase domain-containing protein [Simkania negevensis]|uniref:Protein kinase domain-containing protein n=1 Tax=Simkania negevensis (strain ATCC VR-1471 / DSM 27360 / Z) TaxID=331113 RepID=F8L830_SIMNZ|nr:protein kinase [Simkania negevensis]CCB88933.1 hypothetical protein SNE_A10560 [Simkania negevensis Z]
MAISTNHHSIGAMNCFHIQRGGYIDETDAPIKPARENIVINVQSRPNDGPDGYTHNGPFPNIDQFISPSIGRAYLFDSFTRDYFDNTTATWPQNVIYTIGQSFGRFSAQTLGNGFNSSAFVMQQEGSEIKRVLRTFSIGQLRHPQSQQPLKLNRDHVGGEWINLTLNHPNIASNTHLVVWDSFDNSFRVMNQNQVQAQIENRYMLQEGRQLYAVATIGDYAEGSLDLERYFRLNPRRSEEEVQGMLYDIFQGVAAMNDMQIVHRDLKDANVIRLPTGQMQIIDFGTAGFLNQGESLHVLGGGGILPFESHFEVEGKPRHTNAKTDSFGLFLLTYQALTGCKYFGNDTPLEEIKRNHKELHAKEQSKSFRALLEEDPLLTHISPVLKDLMAQLGTSIETNRLTANEALSHPFFTSRHVTFIERAV